MKKAKITWIEKKEGGRIPPPSGTRYTPLINIKGMEGAWSADFICTELDGFDMLIDIGFLSNDAPDELLVEGCKFELYEGKKLVAFGVVLN